MHRRVYLIFHLVLGTGRLVTATPTGSFDNEFDLVISTMPFNGDVAVKSKRNVNRWFNCKSYLETVTNCFFTLLLFSSAPEFVSMYEIGDYIYLFLREVAVESPETVSSQGHT